MQKLSLAKDSASLSSAPQLYSSADWVSVASCSGMLTMHIHVGACRFADCPRHQCYCDATLLFPFNTTPADVILLAAERAAVITAPLNYILCACVWLTVHLHCCS